MATIQVTVDKFTVQYMLKDTARDIPKMLPVKSYSVDLEVEVDDSLLQYIPAYTAAVKQAAAADSDEDKEKLVPEYCAPKELVKKWRASLMKEFPDSFDTGTDPDMIIDSAISCTIEDTIKDSLESLWTGVLESQLNAAPEVPEGYRIGARYIHLVEWGIK